MRKIRADYNGPLIKVRRSSDNATMDIDFNSNGDLDLAQLLTFVGVGNGFVTTWYDQTTKGAHFSQATAANQPKIVSLGSVNLSGIKPGILFDGTTSFLSANSVGLSMTSSIPGFTSANVVSWVSYTSGACIIGAGSSTGNSRINCQSTTISGSTCNREIIARSKAADSAAIILTTPKFDNSLSVETYQVDFANKQGRIRRAGVTQLNWTAFTNMTAQNSESAASTAFAIGAFGTGASFANINWSECIMYPRIISDTQLITEERNQEAYYGLPII